MTHYYMLLRKVPHMIQLNLCQHDTKTSFFSELAGDVKIIELLLQHGVNVRAQNQNNDKTALLLAIENGSLMRQLII